VHIQLLHDVASVLLNGLDADAEIIGYFLVLVPLADQFQDLALPFGDRVPRSPGFQRLFFLQETFENPLRYPRAEVFSPR
jgi:hypothetical protein